MKADIKRYLRYLERRHPNRSTKKHYASDLNIFVRFVDNKSSPEVIVQDIDAFCVNQSQQQLKPATINRHLVAVSRFFQFLIVEAEVDGWHNPVRWQRRYLKGDEFLRLEEALHTKASKNHSQHLFNCAWFYLLAHGGLRRCEVLNLRTGDCGFSHNHLRVRSGKGNRDRVIPITARLKQALLDYLMIREPSATDHLLLYIGKAVQPHIVLNRLKAFGRLAGIPYVTPHRLRHTLATLLINEVMPIESLQKFLGHQDINVTLVYAKVHNKTVRRQFARAMKTIEVFATTASEPLILEELETKSVSLPDT